MYLSFIFWPLFAALLGYAQGRLLPTLRTEPPDSVAAARNSQALHVWFTLAYFLPLALSPSLLAAGAALVARLLCFDPALNAGAGSPIFYVGQTAAFDKLLRRLAPTHPSRLRAALVAAVALAAGAGFTLFH